jgi:phospholipid-binding lipoprotein MlaA
VIPGGLQPDQPATVTASAPAPAGPASSSSPADDNQDTIVVNARRPASPGDPLQRINAKAFKASEAVDDAVVGPMAMTYKHTVPTPIRSGLRNAFNNLREPAVFVNFLLQLKPGKAAETIARFGINSSIGVAGLIDVAKGRPFKLPRRPNGFGDTLGYYGVKPGPYLFLPVVGPTTLRDLIGGGLDRLVLPMAIGTPFTQVAYTAPSGTVSALDHRVEFDEQLRKFRESSNDPYAARREFYLQQRQVEIEGLHGRRASAVEATR